MKRAFAFLVVPVIAACGGDSCPPENYSDFFDGDILITVTRGDSSSNDDYLDVSALINESLDVGPNGEQRYLFSLSSYCDLLLQRDAPMCEPASSTTGVSLEIVEQRNCRWTTSDGSQAEWTIDSWGFFWKKDTLDIIASGPVTFTTTAGSTESGTAMYRFFGTSAF